MRLTDGEVITAPAVVSNLDLTSTLTRFMDREAMPAELMARVDAIDHRAAWIQMHFALDGLPEFDGPYEVLNEGKLRASMGMFGSPGGHAAGLRGLLPGRGARLAVDGHADPEPVRPRPGARGQARGQRLRLLLPHHRDPRGAVEAEGRHGRAGRGQDRRHGAQLPRHHRPPAHLRRPTPTS